MKKLLYLILTLASFAAYAQPGSLSQSVYRSRVQDSTAAIAANVSAIAAGYAPMFFNDQATTPHWDIWNGSAYDHVFDFNAGSGGGTNIYNSDGTLTGDRSVDANGNDLEFFDVAEFDIGSTGNQIYTADGSIQYDGTTGLTFTSATGPVTFTSTLDKVSFIGGDSINFTAPIIKLGGQVGTTGQVPTINASGKLKYATPSSGGTPGGSTTQVQYNNAGAFGGISGATTNGTVMTLTSPVLVTPALGTVASGVLTGATGLPLGGLTAWASSTVMGSSSSLQIPSQLATSPVPIAFEVINLGNISGDSEDIQSTNTFVGGIAGRAVLGRNLFWNGSAYTTPDQDATAYGSQLIEMGGEGVSLHTSPPGVNFGAVPHLNFLSSADGPRGVDLGTFNPSGYINQSLAPIFAHYESDPETGTGRDGYESWNPSTSTEPLLWLHTGEDKGSAGSALLNELAVIEWNSNDSGFPVFNFRKSNGIKETPTVVSTNTGIGGIGSMGYSGSTYVKSAQMEFRVRGTVTSANVPQSIVFQTSATDQTALTDRFEVTHDALIKSHSAPYIYTNSGVSTVPVYSSFAGFSPANVNSEVFRMQHLSTSTGGAAFYGMSTTSTASTAIALGFIGALGATSPTAPAILFSARKNNGSNSLTDIAGTEIAMHVRNNATNLIEVLGNGTTSFSGGSANSGTVRLMEDTDNGTNYTQLQIGSQSANITYTLPTAAPTVSGHVMSSTTAGVMSWVSKTGSLNTETTTVGNIGTGEDQLFSYTVPAATLAADGNSIKGRISGTVAANGNAKTLKLKFGATTVMTTTVTTSTISSGWVIDFEIIRTGATTQKCNIMLNNPDGQGIALYSTSGETLSGTVALVVTGEATADNDIVKQTAKINFED